MFSMCVVAGTYLVTDDYTGNGGTADVILPEVSANVNGNLNMNLNKTSNLIHLGRISSPHLIQTPTHPPSDQILDFQQFFWKI